MNIFVIRTLLGRAERYTTFYRKEGTVYGKTFERENFCSFLVNRESFPLESFAVYSMGLMHPKNFPVNSVLRTIAKVLPYMVFYLIVIPWARVVCLIYTPKARGPQARGLRVYISGELRVHMV